MSRRKLGEKQTFKGLDIKFRITHTRAHDTTSRTDPTGATDADATASTGGRRMKIRSALDLPQDPV
jgi:hypothetical protein